MAAVVYLAITRADRYIERVVHAHPARDDHLALPARQPLLGADRRDAAVRRAGPRRVRGGAPPSAGQLRRPGQATEDETLLLYDEAEADRERDEFVVIGQMRAIGERCTRPLSSCSSSRPPAGRRRPIGATTGRSRKSWTTDLQRLVDLAIADEREEVRRLDRRTASMARELSAIVLAVTLIGGVTSIVMILLISRALSRPIGRAGRRCRGHRSRRARPSDRRQGTRRAGHPLRPFQQDGGGSRGPARGPARSISRRSSGRSRNGPRSSRTPTAGYATSIGCACCSLPRSATSCARRSRSCAARPR